MAIFTNQAKLIFTEDAVESDDEGISAKLGLYIKARLTDIGNDIRVTTERFRAEHPEYFE